jgi:hypothetical protein
MALVLTPDIPVWYPIINAPLSCITKFLTIYIGESVSWSAYGRFPQAPTAQWYRLPRGPYWNWVSGVAGTFTPPNPGCYRFYVPLTDWYNGVYYNRDVILFYLQVLGGLRPPYVDPLWSLQIGPL